MPEQNNKKQQEVILANSYDYTKLYYYVSAVRQLKGKYGAYRQAKLQLNDIDERLANNKAIDYNRVIFEVQGAFPGLQGVKLQELNRLSGIAYALGNGTFPPQLEQVDQAKKAYDDRLQTKKEKSQKDLETAKTEYKQARKDLSKARRKSVGAWVLAGVAALGAAALVGGFGIAVYSVITSALTATAGIASGFALGGLVLGVAGSKLIFNGVSKIFKSAINRIKKTASNRRQAKEAFKAKKRGLNSILNNDRQIDRQIYLDVQAQNSELRRYPGNVQAPEFVKSGKKEKAPQKESEVDLIVANAPLTEAEKQQKLKEFKIDAYNDCLAIEKIYGKESARKELDPENQVDKQILQYFDLKQKFFQHLDQSIFNNTQASTFKQLDDRYTKEVKDIVDEQFRQYMVAERINQSSEFTSSQKQEEIRNAYMEATEKKVLETLKNNIKTFETENDVKLPEAISTDNKKLVAANKYIEEVTESQVKTEAQEVDAKEIAEKLEEIANTTGDPEIIVKKFAEEKEEKSNKEEKVEKQEVKKEENKQQVETKVEPVEKKQEVKQEPAQEEKGTKKEEVKEEKETKKAPLTKQQRVELYNSTLNALEELEGNKKLSQEDREKLEKIVETNKDELKLRKQPTVQSVKAWLVKNGAIEPEVVEQKEQETKVETSEVKGTPKPQPKKEEKISFESSNVSHTAYLKIFGDDAQKADDFFNSLSPEKKKELHGLLSVKSVSSVKEMKQIDKALNAFVKNNQQEQQVETIVKPVEAKQEVKQEPTQVKETKIQSLNENLLNYLLTKLGGNEELYSQFVEQNKVNLAVGVSKEQLDKSIQEFIAKNIQPLTSEKIVTPKREVKEELTKVNLPEDLKKKLQTKNEKVDEDEPGLE